MIIAITYGDANFTQSTNYNLKTAHLYGKVDKTISYGPKDVPSSFKKKNEKIFSVKKGAGYWLWKPYIINKALAEINYGDYLVYADSGSFYMNSVGKAVEKMEVEQTDLFLSEVDYFEGEYSKRDAFVLMNADEEHIRKTKQMDAAFFVIKKTEQTVRIIQEWLEYCCDYRIISDDINVCGKDNYAEFVENRYDQTVLSLLCKKYGYKSFGNVSQPNPYFTCIEPLSFFKKTKYSQYYQGESAKNELRHMWENKKYDSPIIVRTRFRNSKPIVFKMKILEKKYKYIYRNKWSYWLTKIYVSVIKLRGDLCDKNP